METWSFPRDSTVGGIRCAKAGGLDKGVASLGGADRLGAEFAGRLTGVSLGITSISKLCAKNLAEAELGCAPRCITAGSLKGRARDNAPYFGTPPFALSRPPEPSPGAA